MGFGGFFTALADAMCKFFVFCSASDGLHCYREWTISSSFERPVRSAVRKDSRFLEWGWKGDKVVLGILEVVTALPLLSDLRVDFFLTTLMD